MLSSHATFATFVVGTANRLAATAAKAVAEAPGAMYNPLFIYARPGLGKTHLLMAMGQEAKAIDPQRTVEYVTVDDFVEAYHAALAAGQADAYRRRFTEADLVLLDDAQLLSDQRELQAELLRLTDLLIVADRQLVLAGDRPPEEIQALDERLIRRFAGGLVIDIGAPDYETRLAILARRAVDRGIHFTADVLESVASLPITTVRELLGALNRLVAQQSAQVDPVSVDQSRALLAALGHRPMTAVPEPASGGGDDRLCRRVDATRRIRRLPVRPLDHGCPARRPLAATDHGRRPAPRQRGLPDSPPRSRAGGRDHRGPPRGVASLGGRRRPPAHLAGRVGDHHADPAGRGCAVRPRSRRRGGAIRRRCP